MAEVATLSSSDLNLWGEKPSDPDFNAFLYSKGSDTPVPWWCAADVREAVETQNIAEWEAVFNRYRDMSLTDKPEVTTLTLRFASIDGQEYYEEYFDILPGVIMGPPKIGEDSKISQEEFDKKWHEAGGDFKMDASFSTDVHELAQDIRDWAKDPSLPFPVGMSGDPPSTPVFRSRFELIHSPKIDRFWYAERRLVICLRPINDEERWNVEGSYWQSVGDEPRELLIRELLHELSEQTE